MGKSSPPPAAVGLALNVLNKVVKTVVRELVDIKVVVMSNRVEVVEKYEVERVVAKLVKVSHEELIIVDIAVDTAVTTPERTILWLSSPIGVSPRIAES